MAKTIADLVSDKDRKTFLDKLANLLPDVLGGRVAKTKKKRKKVLDEI